MKYEPADVEVGTTTVVPEGIVPLPLDAKLDEDPATHEALTELVLRQSL